MTDYAVQHTPYVQYTGANTQAIIDRYPPENVLSAVVDPVTGTLVLTEVYNTTLTVELNGYILGWGDTVSGDVTVSEEFFQANYFIPPEIPEIPEIPDPVTYTLRTATAVGALPALTLLSPNYSLPVTWDKPLPLGSITASDLHWRAMAGASVLSTIQLQAIASPIVLNTSGSPSQITGATFHLRTVGLASVAGVLLTEVQKLVQD